MTNLIDYFHDLPDDSPVWIYTANQSIDQKDQTIVLASVSDFISTWTSHQRPVLARCAFAHDRFLVIAAHIPGGDVSGCGIDKLDHELKNVENNASWKWLDGLFVFYMSKGGTIEHVSRSEFRSLVQAGSVTANTLVYDTSLNALGALRREGLERLAGDSWHGRVFGIHAHISV